MAATDSRKQPNYHQLLLFRRLRQLSCLHFSYETSDGQTREESAVVDHSTGDQPVLIVRGSFSYRGPDGVQYNVNYVSDSNGFHPQGDHLPGQQDVDSLLLLPPISTPAPVIAHLPPNPIKSLLGD